MAGCAYCGRNIGGLELSVRTRTARYHEDCRLRELGLPPEPWMLIRVILFIWEDAIPFLWKRLIPFLIDALASPLDSEKTHGDPSEYRRERSPRECSNEMGMKHGDPWL